MNQKLYLIDLENNALTVVEDWFPLPGNDNYNAMTADTEGNLYLAGGLRFAIYNIFSGVYNVVGNLPEGMGSAGDLTFNKGELYLASQDNRMVRVNIENPEQSEIAFVSDTGGDVFAIYGITTFVVDCQESVTLAAAPSGEFFTVDFTTGNLISAGCNLTGQVIYDLTTVQEFQASDCDFSLDLDSNNSSGATGTDYLDTLCVQTAAAVAVADVDVTLVSGYAVDSVTVAVTAVGSPDYSESLTAATVPAGLSAAGSGTTYLRFTPTDNTIAPSNAYAEALQATEYLLTPVGTTVPSQRTLVVNVYASDADEVLTAHTTLYFEQPESAGADNALDVCADAPAFALTDLLSDDAVTGGTWLQTTADGDLIFDPAAEPTGVFSYATAGVYCPGDTAFINIGVQPLPTPDLGDNQNLCDTETYLLSLPNDPTSVYTWQDGTNNNTFSAEGSGTYAVTVTNAAGCTETDSVELTFGTSETATQTVQLCTGESYSYEGQTYIADALLCSTFGNAAGCDSTVCVNLIFTESFSADESAVICAGESYPFFDEILTEAGVYTESFTTAAGCDSLLTLTLDVLPAAEIFLDTLLCAGESFVYENTVLSAEGAFPFTFTSTQGCDSTVVRQVTTAALPTVSIAADGESCVDSIFSLTAESATLSADYLWNTGATDAEILAQTAGSYAVTLTDENGCTATDEMTVSPSAPVDFTLISENVSCFDADDGQILIENISGGNAPYISEISATDENIDDFNDLPAGIYTVTVTDTNGCTAVREIILTEPESLFADILVPQPEIYVGDTLTLSVATNATLAQISWNDTPRLNCTTCPTPLLTAVESMPIFVTVTDENGCSTTTSTQIQVLPRSRKIFVPTAFSPNDDGINDVFYINADERVSQITRMQVYDRWGNLFFTNENINANEPAAGWNGTVNGKPADSGVYVWFAEIIFADGSKETISGDMSLLD